MKRIVLWMMSTLTVLVLLFGYSTSTSSSAAGGRSSAVAPLAGGNGSASGGTGSSSSGSASGGTGSSSSGSTASGATVSGDVAQTRWGPVQVRLTVAYGKVTAVDVVQYPDGNGRDRQINAHALPILVQETLQAQNAKIDMVSGATVTSDGYVQSLQSALDKAGL